MNRLTAMTTPNSGYLYQLGATGNRTSATELTGRSVQWSYDGIYRLTNEAIASDPTGGNGAVAYGLDPVGNRLSSTSTLPRINTSISSYNLDDLMTSSETYDANGNTITSGGRTFAYDSETRLTAMNNGAVSIVYDGFGNREVYPVISIAPRYPESNLGSQSLYPDKSRFHQLPLNRGY